jgi:hypothetical protein
VSKIKKTIADYRPFFALSELLDALIAGELIAKDRKAVTRRLRRIREAVLAAPEVAMAPVVYDAGGGITIHRTRQEPEAWAVRRWLDCLVVDGTWVYEPTPSDRTPEWLALHRFASAEAASHAIPPPQAGEGES